MRLSLGLGLGLGVSLLNAGASAYADGPAPPGFHWEFVTFNGARVTRLSIPVVALVGN